jgi:hypothetical protein
MCEVMRRRFAANVVSMTHRFGFDRTYQSQSIAQLHMRASPSATATSTIFDGTLLTLTEGLWLSSIYALSPMSVKADYHVSDFIKDDPTSAFAGPC